MAQQSDVTTSKERSSPSRKRVLHRMAGSGSYGTTEAALRLFAIQSNKKSLHPLDWERFYRFIVSAHQFRKRWNHSDVKRLLESYGFSENKAKGLAEIYWHARCSLHLSKSLAPGIRYADWIGNGARLN